MTMQNNLNHLVETVIGAALDESKIQTSSPEATEALFAQLSTAAQANDTEFFERLLEAEQQQTRDKNEPTLLIAAVMAGRTKIVRQLIAAGADVNAKIEQFFTFDALGFAVSKGHTEIVKLLLNAGADPNWNNQNPGLCHVTKAVKEGNADILRLLIEHNAALKFGTGFRLLVKAAEESNAEIVQILIDAGCNVNTRDLQRETPLTAACKQANVEIVQTLVSSGANVNKTGMHEFAPLVALLYAPQLNSMLSQHGLTKADHDIQSGMCAIAHILLEAGADTNARDLQGRTPLMLAIKLGRKEIAKILIEAGADINALSQPDDKVITLFQGDGNTITALHLAVEAGDAETVSLLLNSGADPSITDSQGSTPLNWAEAKGSKQILGLLR